jgi:hypothetical protein
MKSSLKYWVRIKKKSFIGAGTFQCMVGSHGGIMSGTRSRVCADVSSISGGYGNLIAAGADCSFIGGGRANTVNGTYSSILGGSGNTVGAAYSYAGIFGQNLNAVSSNTFHVECLNAVNTPGPGCPFGAPPGTIFWDNVVGMPWPCTLFIA